ncbi:MAG: hypothetical protein ABI871_05535 [Chthoniobacterales bacterium]
MSPTVSFDGLPGADLIAQGIADARAGKVTVFACLVLIALPVLQRRGIVPPDWTAAACPDPELTMYRLLQREGGDAFGRYNALLRRLVSFQRSLTSPPSAA